MHIAVEHVRTNTNVLTDEEVVDPLSGNAVLNGVRVEVLKKSAKLALDPA